MSRIEKIINRNKAEKGTSATGNDAAMESRENIRSNIQTFDYSITKTIPVADEKLKGNRIISRDPTDVRAVRFQLLRTKVLQQLRNKNWNTMAITAPTPGAGKSLVAINLAASIALEGNQSVLLVDMDLRKPSIHRYFGITPEYGIHDYLDGSASIEQIMINPGFERLVIMPGRKGVLNSSEQIATPFVKNFVEELKTRYESRLVIFDLPPILLSDDVMVFLPYVDCSLLVVENGANTPDEIEDCLELIGDNPLLGTVLNKAETSGKSFVY